MRKIALLLCVACVFFAGCGDPLIALDETQSDTVSTYAAGVLLKFSPAGKHGLMYLPPSLYGEKEEESKTEELLPEPEAEEVPKEEEASGYMTDDAMPAVAASHPIEAVYDFGGASIGYKGYQLKDAYVQDDYYSLTPSKGKTFLVLNFTFTNDLTSGITIEPLTSGVSFRVGVNGKSYEVVSTMVLDDDISCFSRSLDAGESTSGVFLVEVNPEDAESIETLELYASANGMTGNLPLK